MKKVLKVLGIIFGVIVLALIVLIIWLITTVGVNSKVHKPDEILMNANLSKNALLIYQPSKHDTTKNIAYAAAEELNAKGYNVTINFPSDELTYDLDKYDAVVFGTPIYAGKSSEVLCDYITENQFTGKQVFIFATGADLTATVEIDELEGLLQEGNDVSKIKVGKGDEEKIKAFIDDNLKA